MVLAGLAVAAVATIGGLAWLWPDGSGRSAAIEQAEQIGLATERFEAVVESVTDERCSYSTPGNEQNCRTIVVIPIEGPDDGALVALSEFNIAIPGSAPDVSVGDRIILGYEEATSYYFYADLDRRGSLLVLAAAFAVVVIALGGFRGGLALVSMALTLVVLVGFVAPSVLDGHHPVAVAVVAASLIAFISLYLTHGFNPTTTVALTGTLIALLLTLGLSAGFFAAARFTGLATEEGLILPIIAGDLDMAGLLLGGAIIGALGALDDVTVTQAATVAELHHRNPALSFRDLFASGIRVGREHIASTVNTLLLAYAGAAMPLLLLFAVSNQSLGMVANSELLAVEIVRTLCGSIGLVAAVPITTALAASLISGGTRVSPSPSPDTDDDGPPSSAEPPTATPPRWEDFAPEDDLND